MSVDAVANPVKERPILFSGPMVRAILAGTKTQTRRVVTSIREGAFERILLGVEHERAAIAASRCPYGLPGDRLWVRETFRQGDGSMSVHYAADPDEVSGGPWRPSIFMPRWACRIQLEVTEVRVQRLQEISEEDAIAEGVERRDDWWLGADHPVKGCPKVFKTASSAFESRWDVLNGKRAPWDSNPWVWCLTFKRVA